MGGPPRVPFHMVGSGRVRSDPGLDATAWTVVGGAMAILVAIGASFRSLRREMRDQRKGLADLRERIDALGADLRERIDALGADLRQRIDALGADLRQRIDAQGEQMGLLRERMAHLEGLLDGLREAITKRAA